MEKTGAVLVAAGMPERTEKFIPLLPFGGTTVSMHIVRMLQEMGAAPIVVVIGYKAEQLEAHLFHTGVEFLKNERYLETEMFDSVKMGLHAVEGRCARTMVLSIDRPAILPDTIRQVLAVHAKLVWTVCTGEPGHPVVMETDMIPRICSYVGDRGLRGAVEGCGIPVTGVEVEDEGIYRDVDTDRDYQELLDWNYARGKGYPVRPMTKVRLAASEVFFGPGVCQLLELIEQTGSLREACSQMNLSYSKGSRMVKGVDRQLGFPVVQRWAGGNGGGGSSLTEEGRRLTENYRRMEEEVQRDTEKIYQKYFGQGFRE